jgi:uncharacterized protein (DUF305 family)
MNMTVPPRATRVVLGVVGFLCAMPALSLAQQTTKEHAGHHPPAAAPAAPAPTQSHGDHAGMKQGMGGDNASTAAYAAINNKMHEDMSIEFTGDADVDFVRGMIPHHQAAIDMAKVALAFGKDPEIKKLAESVIKAQEGEIAMMNDWLVRNAK